MIEKRIYVPNHPILNPNRLALNGWFFTSISLALDSLGIYSSVDSYRNSVNPFTFIVGFI